MLYKVILVNLRLISYICSIPPFFLGNSHRIRSNGDRLKNKNSKIVMKSEFFYALVARFCSLLYCFLWLGSCTCFNEKTTLVLESGFGYLLSYLIVKWLKSPNGANIGYL